MDDKKAVVLKSMYFFDFEKELNELLEKGYEIVSANCGIEIKHSECSISIFSAILIKK